jgi:hypothetical protein
MRHSVELHLAQGMDVNKRLLQNIIGINTELLFQQLKSFCKLSGSNVESNTL